MCKIKTILRVDNNVQYSATIDADFGTISSLDVPSGCIIDFNTERLDVQYKFPSSTEEVANYPTENDSKIKFEYGKISGKIHRYIVLREEIKYQKNTSRILNELHKLSDSERFQGNVNGFIILSSFLIRHVLDHFPDNATSKENKNKN